MCVCVNIYTHISQALPSVACLIKPVRRWSPLWAQVKTLCGITVREQHSICVGISFLFWSGSRWNYSDLSFTPLCIPFFFFFFFTFKSNTVIYHATSNPQGQREELVENQRWADKPSTVGVLCLPWRHLRQFMRGSLRGGASQTQQTSSTPTATGEDEGGGRQTDKQTDRAVSSINLCISIHILATPLISVSPASFHISLHLTGGCSAGS